MLTEAVDATRRVQRLDLPLVLRISFRDQVPCPGGRTLCAPAPQGARPRREVACRDDAEGRACPRSRRGDGGARRVARDARSDEDRSEAQTSASRSRFPPEPAKRTGLQRMTPGRAVSWTPGRARRRSRPSSSRKARRSTCPVAIFAGAISYNLELSDQTACSDETETRDMEVEKDGVWVLEPQEVPTGTKCPFTPGSTYGFGDRSGRRCTGPCGSFIAVQEGRAEFAACGQGYDADFYGVIGKDEELWGISGTFEDKDGRGLGRHPRRAVGRGATGGRVAKHDRLLRVPGPGGQLPGHDRAGLLRGGRRRAGLACSSSASVSVPGSHAVDFRPEKEGTIAGTVFDADGNGLGGVTVSAVGRMGSICQRPTTRAHTSSTWPRLVHGECRGGLAGRRG